MFNKIKAITSTLFSDRHDNVPSLSSLPIEIIWHIASFLDRQSLGRASRVDHRLHAFLKEFLIPVKTKQLLEEVMYVNPKEVEALLKMLHADSQCIVLKKVAGLEECGRSWKSVSPLEYAAWAGDTKMVRILLKAVPPSEHKEALKQLQDVKEKGLENCMYLSPYISLIEAYVEYINKFDDWNEEEQKDYWVHQINKKQFRLPWVGLYEMCNTVPSVTLPSFKHGPDKAFKLFDEALLVPPDSPGCSIYFEVFKTRMAAWAEDSGTIIASLDAARIRRSCDACAKALDSFIEQLQVSSVEMESHQNTDRRVIF